MLSVPKLLPTKWALFLSNLPVNNFLQSTMSQGRVSIHFTKCVLNTDCTVSVNTVSLTLTLSLHLSRCPPCSSNRQGRFNLVRAFAIVTSVQGTVSPQIPVRTTSSHTSSLTRGRWPFLTYIYKGIFIFSASLFSVAVISGLLSPVCLSLSEHRQRKFSRRVV